MKPANKPKNKKSNNSPQTVAIGLIPDGDGGVYLVPVDEDGMVSIKKLTHAEAGRLGGLKGGKIGGKISRGGGRPKKYQTDEERLEAKREAVRRYRLRGKIKKAGMRELTLR